MPGVAPFDPNVPETCVIKHQEDLLGKVEILVEVVGFLLDDLTAMPKPSAHLKRRALQEWIEVAKSKEHLDLVAVGGCAAFTL